MDFNRTICAGGLGYPLVYAFNQTEADGRRGDWVYLPGSLARRGEREELPLMTWDGAGFALRTREHPLFVPFVATVVDGAWSPLSRVHTERMRQLPGMGFRVEADTIYQRSDDVRAMLAILLERATESANPRRAFSELIGHAARLDGRITRASIQRDGAGYWLNDQRFDSTAALVGAALAPFAAVADPDRFFAELGGCPEQLPVMSGLLVGLLSALFGTHYPGVGNPDGALTSPFNPHFHWGARDMAGFPPRRRGYFAEKSTRRCLRRLCDILSDEHSIDPLLFVLMPAAIYLLCPADAHPRDAELLAGLFERVSNETSGFADATDDRAMSAVDSVVRSWLVTARPHLSRYLLHRFNARRGVIHDTAVPCSSSAVEPDGFAEATLRQACMIVGALVDALSEPETQS